MHHLGVCCVAVIGNKLKPAKKVSIPLAKPHILVPELALLAPLPKHLQVRFAKALNIMNSEQGLVLNWQQVAQQSAISPAHFHRQFKALFHETPGRYLARQQLTKAVIQLFQAPERSITEIALDCGFSSSQALAKTVKRELGKTAKELRLMANTATPAQTTEIIKKLSQPAEQDTQEIRLASQMPLYKQWFDQRSMKVLKVKEADWDYLSEHHWNELTRLRMQTPIRSLDKDWRNIKVIVGDTQVLEVTHNNVLPAGDYLCTEVLISTATAYLTALETMFRLAQEQGYKIDYSGDLVEVVLATDEEYGLTFSFQIPLKP